MEWIRMFYWTYDEGKAIITIDALTIDALK